jgi:superfamily I DNA/RNA helicase
MDLSEYNDKQKEAITYDHGNLMILAGAGTGKTKVLTGRMSYLVEEKKVNPREIMGITFSTMAANQMKDRLSVTIPRESLIWVRTIHSMSLMILREFAPVEWKPSGIVSGKVRSEYALEALKSCGFSENQFQIPAILGFIDQVKTSEDPEKKLAYSDKNMVSVYQAYVAQLDFLRLVDFPDLIHRSRALFEQVPAVSREVKRNLKYILVDEFQDLDPAQYSLVKTLAGKEIPLTVVGDDDQAIYNFRGSSPEIFNRFNDLYLPHIVSLDVSYRCTETILRSAQRLIKNNTSRIIDKALKSARSGDGVITVKGFRFPEEEVTWIVSEIKNAILKTEPSHIAVLARTRGILEAIRTSLVEKKIPVYRPAIDFYQTKEYGDLSSWLQLICLPTLDVAFERALMVPKRGLGEGVIGALREIGQKRHIPLIEASEEAIFQGLLGKEREEVLSEFTRKLSRMRDTLKSYPSRPGLLISSLLKEIEYDAYLHSQYGSEHFDRKKQIVQTLIDMAQGYEDQYGSGATLLNFVNELALETLTPMVSDHKGVLLLTFHSAKGLEFDHVFLAGVEHGVIPHVRSSIEEERRLMYVASTRAISKLVISWVEYRGRNRGIPSLFIEEMREGWNSKPIPV